jgi:GH15 family glucan-1,4-alpha-glucosidase
MPTKSPSLLIEDHALIGDQGTAALVTRDGSIDFLCLPDFDGEACFLSLLGTVENGRWQIAPSVPVQRSSRRYRGDTMILETEFVTEGGAVRLTDFMPLRNGCPRVVRRIEGLHGQVPLRFDFTPRFAHGLTHPLIQVRGDACTAIAGPDALYLRGGRGPDAPADHDKFTVREGERIDYDLSWARPYEPVPPRIDVDAALRETERYWSSWAATLRLPKEHAAVMKRSLLTLKACIYAPSGAIVAAPTFGLPETLGGGRNWDYRFCWLRDAWLTLSSFIRSGLVDEAKDFAQWLIDAVGGAASQIQIMYGIRGERRLTEVELDWLPGYEGSRPVRIGNGAYDQFQLDVFGEFAAVLHEGVQGLGKPGPRAINALKAIAELVAQRWTEKDHGIWEMRGPTRDFTASKVSAWVAIDRWVKAIGDFRLAEDASPWMQLRSQIFDEICDRGYDSKRNTFTQYYGSKGLDASLLFIPASGILPPNDPRVVGTVKAIEEELLDGGLVLRYRTEDDVDGLSGKEGVFLPCSFWLAKTYQMMGREQEAHDLFDRLAGLCNDLGLLAEEYLPDDKRQVGNFPQAFSHLALVNTAFVLAARPGKEAARTATEAPHAPGP